MRFPLSAPLSAFAINSEVPDLARVPFTIPVIYNQYDNTEKKDQPGW
jgi:hypothetical protein